MYVYCIYCFEMKST